MACASKPRTTYFGSWKVSEIMYPWPRLMFSPAARTKLNRGPPARHPDLIRIPTQLRLGESLPNRKNALFYKTLHGAEVGDLFMSLIHTCQLAGVNSFEYLTELQRHAGELAARPEEWMPWNYRERLTHSPPSG